MVAVVCIVLVPIGLTAAQSASYEESWNESSGGSISAAFVHDNNLIISDPEADVLTKYDRNGNVVDTLSGAAPGTDGFIGRGGAGAAIDRESGIVYIQSDYGDLDDTEFVAIDVESMEVVDRSGMVDSDFGARDIAFDSERDRLYFAAQEEIGVWDVGSGTMSIEEPGSPASITGVAVDDESGTVYGYGEDYVVYDESFTQLEYTEDEFSQEMFDAEYMHDRDRTLLAGDDGTVMRVNPSDVSDRQSLFGGATPETFEYDVINYREGTDVIAWHSSGGDIGFYEFSTGNRTTIATGTGYTESVATWDWNSIGIAYTGTGGIAAYELNASGVAPPGDLDFDVNTYMRPGTSQTYSVEFSLEAEDAYNDVTENTTVTSSDNDTLTVYPSNNTLVATGNTSELPDTVTVTAEYENRTTTKDVTIAEPSIDNLDQLPTWWKVNATVGDGMMLWLIVATLAAVVATRAATPFAGVGAYVMFMIAGWMTGSVSDGVMVATILTGLFLGLNLAANVDTTIRGSG